MSWMLDLYEVYEENEKQVGIVAKNRFGNNYTLLPISHVYQDAQIEVSVDFDGNFVTAEVIPKEDSTTLIPCTIDSANRTSKPVPHPLHDKLMYVAGDFIKYGGKVKKDYIPYQDYLKQLGDWCEFDTENNYIEAIYRYISKECLIKDLIEVGVLHEHDYKLIPKWTEEYHQTNQEKPEIFKSLPGDQFSAFVRFNIFDSNIQTKKVWKNTEMFYSFIKFYESKLEEKGLCYVTGKSKSITNKHPSGLRYGGDMAKIISGNDTSGYTFRGRFKDKDEVITIGYETSQKAHNALKWLITKQGQIIDGRVFLTWGKKCIQIPSPADSLLEQFQLLPIKQDELSDQTQSRFAKQFRQAINGYKNNMDSKEKVSIMVLDAATPGRMSIVYYQQFEANLYLDRIRNWHETCSWRHIYKRDDKSKKLMYFYGAPANRDIARAAYGSHVSDQIIKNTMSRLLPSIVEGRSVPRDIVQLLVIRASKPQNMENWEWERTLSIACSMVKKYYKQKYQEELNMALNKESTDRSYLFGRMLAVADILERSALASKNEYRMTNAKRYMTAFSRHPMSTWKVIRENLLPYQARLGGINNYYEKILGEIAQQFDEKEFNDQPLSGKYLIGYDSQRQDIYIKNKQVEEQK